MLDHVDTRAPVAKQDCLHWIDQSEKPAWGTAPDGRRVKIEGDERLDALFSEWQADACQHPRRVTIRWVNGGGAFMHQRFCFDCGTKVSQFLKKEDAEREGISETTKDTLASKHRAYEASRQASLNKIANDAAERCQPGNRIAYDDYLRTPEWKRKVALILKRADNTCEGCLSRPATQVHHLTYAHIYHEFAWELRAVCDVCHARVHSEAAE